MHRHSNLSKKIEMLCATLIATAKPVRNGHGVYSMDWLNISYVMKQTTVGLLFTYLDALIFP